MRWIGLITALLLGFGCAPTHEVIVEVAAPPPINLSEYGPPAQLNSAVEIKGMGTVWIEDTPFLLTVLETRWDDIETDKGSERSGRAKIRVWEPIGSEREKTVTIEEGRTKTVFGHRITVTYAFRYVDSTGREVAHTKLTIQK